MYTPIRDLWVGRLGLPTVDNPISEQLGSEVTTAGDATAVGQRRVKGFTLVFPIHGGTGDTDPYAAGQRMRRQLRALMQNHPYRLGGVYISFRFDPERSGWIVMATGNLADKDGGSTLAEYELTLDQAFRLGGLASHREGFRLDIVDLRQTTAPLDLFGQYVNSSAGFAGLSSLPLAYFPVGAADAAVLDTPAASGQRLGWDGSFYLCAGRSNGDVVSWDRAEGQLNKGDVVVYDRRGSAGPFGAGSYDASPYVALQNLCPNPSFQYDPLGAAPALWQTSGPGIAAGAVPTVVEDATAPVNGGRGSTPLALRVVASAAGQGAIIATPSGSYTPGSSFTMSCWLRGAAGGEQVQLVLGNAASYSGGLSPTLTLGTAWARYSVTWQVPAGVSASAVYAALRSLPGAGGTLYLDGCQVEAGSTMSGYVDGDQRPIGSFAAWSGAPGLSPSLLLLDPQYAYGWEEVPGPDYPWADASGDVPVLQNGLCRVRYDATNTPGFRLDLWSASAQAWVEQGKVTLSRVDTSPGGAGINPLNTLLSSGMLEWTPERAVVYATMQASADALSRERVYLTLQRGWSAPRIEVYAAAGSGATGLANVGAAIAFSTAQADTNDAADVLEGSLAAVSTAGSGSALFSSGAVGAAGFTGENWLHLLREGAGWHASFAVLQPAMVKSVQQSSLAYGAARNTVVLTAVAGGWGCALPGFYAASADQVMEAETMTLGSGTTAVADGGAVGGQTTQTTRAADAIHVSRASWPNGSTARYRIRARLRLPSGTASLYAKTGATTGVTVTAPSSSYGSYGWLDLGEVQANGTALEIHAWTSSGTLFIDRVVAIKVEDRTRTALASSYDGARDHGQRALADTRTEPRRILRG